MNSEVREIRETWLDGSVSAEASVKLRNRGPHVVSLTGKNAIRRETCVLVGTKSDGTKKYANRELELVIKVGEVVAVPVSVANLLVTHGVCFTCGSKWIFGRPNAFRKGPPVCTDLSHPRSATGGLAPWLDAVDDGGQVLAEVPLDKNLVEQPAPSFDPIDLHARLMSRIGGGK